MNEQLRQLRERFDALAPRERLMVMAAAIVVAGALLYLAIWKPLQTTRADLRSALAAEKALATRIVAAKAEVAALRGGSAPTQGANRSLLAIVDQSGRAIGLGEGIRGVTPDGDNRARVRLDNVAFDDTVRWMDQLENRYGVAVQTADVSAKDKPGQIEARIAVTR